MNEKIKQETIKGNGKLKVNRKIIDLIKGLRTLTDVDDCYWLLKHLNLLSRLIDDIASDDVQYDMPDISIADLTFYQQWIIGKIESVLTAQDDIIAQLHSIVHKAEEAAGIPFEHRHLEMAALEVKANEEIKVGALVTIDENKMAENVRVDNRASPLGVAARDIKKYELFLYNPNENTDAIIVKRGY